MGRPLLDQQNCTMLIDCATAELSMSRVFPLEHRSALPFQWHEEIRILGVIFDPLLTFRGHIQKLMQRAQLRHCIMSSLSRTNWGLETGILRTTHSAQLVSLTRFGLATIGSGAYEADLVAMEMKHSNISARRVLGMNPTARLETLFSTSDLLSTRNLYLRSCAMLLDRSLRAPNCDIQERLSRSTQDIYKTRSWVSMPTMLSLPTLVESRTFTSDHTEQLVYESWLSNLLPDTPCLPDRFRASSTFFTNAPEINSTPSLKAQTFNFIDCGTWYETGLQMLCAAGWRPDCTQESQVNATRSLPPTCRYAEAYIAIGSPISHEGNPCGAKNLSTASDDSLTDGAMIIEVATFFMHHYGTSCSYLQTPDGSISCQGWVFGHDPTRVAPVFVREFALLHGCVIAMQTLQRYLVENLPLPGIIYIKAGSHMICDNLHDWLTDGIYRFSSAAGPGIVDLLHQLAGILLCPLIIQCAEAEQYSGGVEWDEAGVPSSFILRTQVRLLNGFLSAASPQVLSRIPRIPLTKSEVKERLLHRYECDERLCFLLLAQQGSISCTLFIEWRLTRAIIKSALQELFYNRRLQVTLASILVGTRFKYFDTLMGGGSTRLPTQCRLCGERDSPAHIMQHAEVSELPTSPEELVQFLVALAQSAEVLNPHLSTPCVPETSRELELEMESSSCEEQDEINSLSFEGDIPEITL